jgi:3-phenylpropionate/cinnamic acid dioxygenase small subunit
MRSSRIDDRTEILNLLYRYAELIDDGDFAGIGELLADCEMSGVGMPPVRGARAIAGLYKMTTRRFDNGTPNTAHIITNPIVEVGPDSLTATVRSRFTVFQSAGGVPLQPIITGRYRDGFEKVEGAWRFATRYLDPRLAGDLSQHLMIDLPPAGG